MHEVEVADDVAQGLEISTRYGSIEKLGRLMDPAEPTRPAGEESYRFVGWRLGEGVVKGRKIEVCVEGKTELTAVYGTGRS